MSGLLAYSLKLCMSLMQNKKFRNEVLRVLVKLYMNLEKPDFINVCQVCLLNKIVCIIFQTGIYLCIDSFCTRFEHFCDADLFREFYKFLQPLSFYPLTWFPFGKMCVHIVIVSGLIDYSEFAILIECPFLK